MKKSILSIVATLAVVASSGASASTVLSGVRIPGFEPNRVQKTFTLDSSGQLSLQLEDQQTGHTTIQDLGKLSALAMTKIMSNVANIDPATPLVDAQEGQPMCTDTPTFIVSAVVKGKPVVIKRNASCHEWNLSSYEGTEAAGFVDAFLNL